EGVEAWPFEESCRLAFRILSANSRLLSFTARLLADESRERFFLAVQRGDALANERDIESFALARRLSQIPTEAETAARYAANREALDKRDAELASWPSFPATPEDFVRLIAAGDEQRAAKFTADVRQRGGVNVLSGPIDSVPEWRYLAHSYREWS